MLRYMKTQNSPRMVPALLMCGIIAGLLFLIASFTQAFTRPGFDLQRHAISSLALGDLGWLQVSNFIITGLFAGAFAIGLWQALRGTASKAVPLLVGIYSVAMVGGGLFTPDPGLGWPIGAPAGLPEPTFNSIMHIVFGMLAFMSIIIAGFVFARRFIGLRNYGWAVYSGINSLLAFVLTALPWNAESESIRFAVGAILISGWITIIAWHTRSQLTQR